MRPLRHRFAEIFFCKKHNDLVATGDTHHLNQHKAGPQEQAQKDVETLCVQQNEEHKILQRPERIEINFQEGNEVNEELYEGNEVHEVRAHEVTSIFVS